MLVAALLIALLVLILVLLLLLLFLVLAVIVILERTFSLGFTVVELILRDLFFVLVVVVHFLLLITAQKKYRFCLRLFHLLLAFRLNIFRRLLRGLVLLLSLIDVGDHVRQATSIGGGLSRCTQGYLSWIDARRCLGMHEGWLRFLHLRSLLLGLRLRCLGCLFRGLVLLLSLIDVGDHVRQATSIGGGLAGSPQGYLRWIDARRCLGVHEGWLRFLHLRRLL